MPDYVEIIVKEVVDKNWSKQFYGMELLQSEDEGTMIAGYLPDKSALHGVLESIRDLNLTLVSVSSIDQKMKEKK